jgi:hypothetical protein
MSSGGDLGEDRLEPGDDDFFFMDWRHLREILDAVPGTGVEVIDLARPVRRFADDAPSYSGAGASAKPGAVQFALGSLFLLRRRLTP